MTDLSVRLARPGRQVHPYPVITIDHKKTRLLFLTEPQAVVSYSLTLGREFFLTRGSPTLGWLVQSKVREGLVRGA